MSMEIKHEKILSDAIKLYGEEAQIDMMIEEAGELITALMHYKRGRVTKDKVCEEIADVKIMAGQMEIIFGKFNTRVQEEFKINRLEERMIVHRSKQRSAT